MEYREVLNVLISLVEIGGRCLVRVATITRNRSVVPSNNPV